MNQTENDDCENLRHKNKAQSSKTNLLCIKNLRDLALAFRSFYYFRQFHMFANTECTRKKCDEQQQ